MVAATKSIQQLADDIIVAKSLPTEYRITKKRNMKLDGQLSGSNRYVRKSKGVVVLRGLKIFTKETKNQKVYGQKEHLS